MKTFKKGNEFKRVKDFSMKDLDKMNNLLKDGWNYCSKKEYKDFYKTEKTQSEKKTEEKESKKKIKK